MGKDTEIMHNAFPVELESDINTIFELVDFKTEWYHEMTFDVIVNDEILHIPERIYYQEVDENKHDRLSTTQQLIIDCLYTRHHNGYIRQERLNRIFASSIDTWVIPYIVRLMGDYVIEIINDINKKIDLIDKERMRKFIRNNQSFIQTIESRIESYWGEYYRWDYKRDSYVGFKIKDYIETLKK